MVAFLIQSTLIPALCLLSRYFSSSPPQALRYFRCNIQKLYVELERDRVQGTWRCLQLEWWVPWRNRGRSSWRGGALGRAVEHVQQVFPAAFTIPSHVSCLIDKIACCPLRSLEMKGTTKYHDYKIETMGQAPCCLQSVHALLRAWRRIRRLVQL